MPLPWPPPHADDASARVLSDGDMLLLWRAKRCGELLIDAAAILPRRRRRRAIYVVAAAGADMRYARALMSAC